MSTVIRETRETRVRVELAPGSGEAVVDTGLPFLDHMLTALARTSGLDLTVHARGDLAHHTVEDVAITLGAGLLGLERERAVRYGQRAVAMDDALVEAVLDLGTRPYYRGPLPSRRYDHWMRSFATEARITLHLRVVRGSDRHHVVEAAFKALGLALRQALADSGAPASTKGAVSLEVRA